MLEGHAIDDDLTFDIKNLKGRGELSLEELCEDGSLTKVTMENVTQYVDLYRKHRSLKTISKKKNHLKKKGFSDLLFGSALQKSFFQVLCLEYLDLMFGGDQTEIKIEDWKEHKIYEENGDGYQATNREIVWFWKIVEGMTKERQMNLLKF